MAGAIQAHRAGKNPYAGAALGGTVSAVSYGINQYFSGLGGSIVGSFASGAFSSGVTSAAYGGNAWKAALYGGLYSAASAATVQGGVALSQSIISYSSTPSGSDAQITDSSTSSFSPGGDYSLVHAQVYPGVPAPNLGQFFSGLIDFMQTANGMNLAGEAMRQVFQIALTVPYGETELVHVCFRPGPPAYDLSVGRGAVLHGPEVRCTVFEIQGLKGGWRQSDPSYYDDKFYWRKL
jgi:hypothetical protein